MTTISNPTAAAEDRPVPACPFWCDVDHEKQQREMSVLASLRDDMTLSHHRTLVAGHDTESHGPLYDVELEQDDGGTVRLWTHLEAVNLNADQAEVYGLALLRAASMLRACGNISDEVLLTSYWDGEDGWVRPGRTVVQPTDAELKQRAIAEGAKAGDAQ